MYRSLTSRLFSKSAPLNPLQYRYFKILHTNFEASWAENGGGGERWIRITVFFIEDQIQTHSAIVASVLLKSF